MLTGLETVLEFVSKDALMCVEQNLVHFLAKGNRRYQPELFPAPPPTASALAASALAASEVVVAMEALTLALLGLDDFREWCWCCFC